MKNIFKYTLGLLLLAGVSISCDNFLEPSVDQEKPTATVIQSADDLQSLVLGVHDDLNSINLYGRNFVAAAEAMSDNAFSNQNSGRFIDESAFNYTVTDAHADNVWEFFYQAIATANIVINDETIESTPQVDYIKGQAYALRALSHMNILLAYGQQFVTGGTMGVPYVVTYNEGNLYPAREPAADVWNKIGDDFEQAVSLMDPSLDAGNVAYINYYAVRALQSRYYLYTGEFGQAITAADDVIDNSGLSLVDAASLASTWASGSGPSSLFELVFTSTDRSGTDNIARIFRDTNYGDLEATQDLYDAYDAADARRTMMSVQGDTVRMSGKYVDELGTDNIRVIRFAEVLLNKAEALSRRNEGTDRAEALVIINDISSTRGSSTIYTTATPADVLAERRLELAMEGHRFYDLARNGLDIPNVALPTRGVNFNNGNDLPYGDYRYALPIPNAEINANSNMEQNEGYN